MKSNLFLFLFIFSACAGYSQWFAGPIGGAVANDIFVSSKTVRTWFNVSPEGGVQITYFPENKKPGIKFIILKNSYGFKELGPTGEISYKNSGLNLQFLNILYFPIKSAKIGLQMGPAINYFNNPQWTLRGTHQSNLPEFNASQVNKLMLEIEGGVSISHPFGRFNVDLQGLFGYNVSKVYKNLRGTSNLITAQALASLQFRISK